MMLRIVFELRLDQVLYDCASHTGELISHVRDELEVHQLLLAASLLSRRRADSDAAQSALRLAAYSLKVDTAAAVDTMLC